MEKNRIEFEAQVREVSLEYIKVSTVEIPTSRWLSGRHLVAIVFSEVISWFRTGNWVQAKKIQILGPVTKNRTDISDRNFVIQ